MGNRDYYFGIGNGNDCWGRASFAKGDSEVVLRVHCATNTNTVTLTRVNEGEWFDLEAPECLADCGAHAVDGGAKDAGAGEEDAGAVDEDAGAVDEEPDPLIGHWIVDPASGMQGVCDFFPGGGWTNRCGFGSGWPTHWWRKANGTYSFGVGSGCSGTADFNDEADAVKLKVRCDSGSALTYYLIRADGVARGDWSVQPPTCLTAPTALVLRTIDDPLIGTWQSDGSTVDCTILADGSWTNRCGVGSGWASSWRRLNENEYYFGISNGAACYGTTDFSDDARKLTLVTECGSSERRTYRWTRVE